MYDIYNSSKVQTPDQHANDMISLGLNDFDFSLGMMSNVKQKPMIYDKAEKFWDVTKFNDLKSVIEGDW